MIVGTGNVGASIAFALLNQRTPVNELILTDINADDARGEAMDLSDALAVAPSYLKITAGDLTDAKDCDVIVITAGAPQKDGKQSRLALLKDNAKILKNIVEKIMKSGFKGIFIIVSNPVDVLSYLTWQWSGLPSHQVIGSGTVLDSARLRHRIAEELNIHPKSVHAYQVGEHGDSELTLWSLGDIGGEALTDLIKKPARDKISQFVRDEAYKIVAEKGATYYGIATCVAQILNCIFGDERRILTVSSHDDNTDTYNGFPAVIGRYGVLRRIDLKMTEKEQIAFQKSANVLKEAIKKVTH